MQPAAPVIDLDLLPAGPATPSRAALPRGPILASVGLAVVVLLAAGAAAPPNPPVAPARRVTVSTTAAYEVVGDTLYVTELEQGDGQLTAYPLTGGPPRWSTRLTIQGGGAQLAEIGDVVLVISTDPGADPRTRTEALDRRTGTVRWESPLSVGALDLGRGRVVLAEAIQTDRFANDPGGDVVAVAAASGERVWTYHRGAGCMADIQAAPREDVRAPLAVLCADGTLTAVDPGSGRVRATARGALSRPPDGAGFGIGVHALADRIVVTYPVPGSSILASFDVDRLTEQWRINLGQANYGVSDCGPQLCLSSAAGGVRAVDRGTGRPSWRLPSVANIVALDSRTLVAFLGANQVDLVDSGTGHGLMHFDGWTIARFEAGRPLFYRPQFGVHSRMWVAVLSRDPLGLEVLGSVPNPNADVSDCRTSERYLACRTVMDTIQVWRISPPD